ncbi:MAG TPA: cytochrome P450 [Mycobacteriales bacterium]|nr:cytochrome P450 [Mycobacteriales bacterium]
MATGFTFDRFSADNVADPYPLYRAAREQAPVHYAEAFDVWVVTRYEDVRRVVMDPMRFSSAFPVRTPQLPAPGVREILAEGHPEVPALINEDPPAHRRTRDVVTTAFSPDRIAALAPVVTGFVEELVDGFADRRRADLVAELALPLPLRVTCALIGLPAGDLPRIRVWAAQIALLVSVTTGPQEQRAAARASVEFERYLTAEIAARRDYGRGDVLTALVAGGLTDAQLISLVISLTFAGQETTAHLIGSALVLVLHRPELWAALAGDPGLLAAVVEETLRFDGPMQGVFRRAVFDVQVGGVTIPAGARVFAALASAGRDGQVFADPDQFAPGRTVPEPPLAFGRGIHSCLGEALARMQAATAIRVLRDRIPGLRLAAGVQIPYRPDFLHRGPAALPTTWA